MFTASNTLAGSCFEQIPVLLIVLAVLVYDISPDQADLLLDLLLALYQFLLSLLNYPFQEVDLLF